MFLGTGAAESDLVNVACTKAVKIKNYIELITPAIKHRIKAVHAAAKVSDTVFATIFEPLIEQVIMYYQLLPRTSNENLGSLTLTALVRAEMVLQKWERPVQYADNDFWEIYVVFSAALLKDLGHIFQYFRINLLDKDGNALKQWNPLSGPMLGQGEYYSMLPLYVDVSDCTPEVVAILARQLISPDVYAALAVNRDLYYQWFALLKAEKHLYGRFDNVLQLFKDEDALKDALINFSDIISQAEFLDNYDLQHGIEFLDWVNKELKNGNLDINITEAGLHILRDGLFIEPSLIVEFLRRNAIHSSFLQSWLQFVRLMGGATTDASNYMMQAYYKSDNNAAFSLLDEASVTNHRDGYLIPHGILEVKGAVSDRMHVPVSRQGIKNYAAPEHLAIKNT